MRAQEGLRWLLSHSKGHPRAFTFYFLILQSLLSYELKKNFDTHAPDFELALARSQLADGVKVARARGIRVRGLFALWCVGSEASEDDVGQARGELQNERSASDSKVIVLCTDFKELET